MTTKKSPPSALDAEQLQAEQTVLGAMLIGADAADAVASAFTAEDFGLEGHRAIFRALQGLRQQGASVDPDAIAARLDDAALEKIGGPSYLNVLREKGQDASDMEQSVKKVVERSQQRRAATGDWETPVFFTDRSLPAFPVEALPAALSAYLVEVAGTVQVPVDMPALLALAVIGAAGARRCRVQIGETHTEPLNLYVATVMAPGTRKSNTLEAVAFPLQEAEREMVARAAGEIAEAREKRAIEEKRLAHLRDQAAKTNDAAKRADLLSEAQTLAKELTEPPATPRLLADDVTPEAAAELAAGQAGCLAIFSAEGGIFGTLAGRYSDGKANLDLFLKGHSGEPVRVDRKGKDAPPLFIHSTRLSLGLAVQPDVLGSLADNPAFRGRGLLGRFLYGLPDSLVGTRKYQNRPIDPQAKADYAKAVRAILSLPMAATEADPARCHPLLIDREALNVWEAHYNDVEERQAAGGDLHGVPDWASKLAGAVARIAGGLHLVRHHLHPTPWEIDIEPETVVAAWRVGEYLIPHALAAFGQMGADPNHALALRLLHWVERKGLTGFSLRDCHQDHRGVNSSQELLPALALLCDRGYLRETARGEVGPKGGRPKGAGYEVNPTLKTRRSP